MSSSTCSGLYLPRIADTKPIEVMPSIAATRSMNGLPLIAVDGLGRNTIATRGVGEAAFGRASERGATTAMTTHARASARQLGRCTRRHYNLRSVRRNFVKFSFFKVDPAWRRLDPAERERHKREFAAACDNFAADRFLRAFSLVGTRGDADLMLWCSAPGLADIHEFHVVLGQSGLMAWTQTPYSYLAMTKESEYSEEDRLDVHTAQKRYLFVYPFWKQREWYRLPGPERMRIMQEHIEIGRKYPSISINTTYSFGLDDQEFVVAFETDEPADFLDLVHELRGSESSSFTLRATPIFTCIASRVRHALDALDGQAGGATARDLAELEALTRGPGS